MPGITIDPNGKTLRNDSWAGFGVTIEQIELRCKTCGQSFMTPVPYATGNLPRDWYVCPRLCNKATKKAA